MRILRLFLVPGIFGLILLTMAFVTRSGWFARDNPGAPINSAMREYMGQMLLPNEDEAIVSQRWPNAVQTSTGLRYVVTREGDGVTRPRAGQMVAAHYRGMLLDGTPVDDSHSKGEPLRFPVGQTRVLAGWDEAFLTMTQGEQRTLIIPYWLGYGEKGVAGRIPPKATLIFDVELVEVGE